MALPDVGKLKKRLNPLWTNISTAQFPDAFHATINGKSVVSLINNDAWIQNEFIPIVQVSQSPLISWRKTERDEQTQLSETRSGGDRGSKVELRNVRGQGCLRSHEELGPGIALFSGIFNPILFFCNFHFADISYDHKHSTQAQFQQAFTQSPWVSVQKSQDSYLVFDFLQIL